MAQQSPMNPSRELIMEAQPSTMSSKDWKRNLDAQTSNHLTHVHHGISMAPFPTLNSPNSTPFAESFGVDEDI